MLDRRFLGLTLAVLACARVGGGKTGGNDPPPPPPPATCPTPIGLADVSSPTTVVGDGTAASCTENAFSDALARGGVITFQCPQGTVIPITAAKQVLTDTVIDGGDAVTLDGGGTSRLLVMDGGNYELTTPTLRLQRLTLRNGRSSGAFPEGGGAAVYHFGGSLEVVQCTFQGNQGASSGTDVAGGAIYGIGLGSTTIVGSVFTGNSAASAGAVGVLASPLTLVNDLFDGNQAVEQNGGAVTMDDRGGTLLVCGSVFKNNSAHDLAGALFRTALVGEPTRIDQSLFQGNTAGRQGTIYLMGSPLEMTASTVAGNSAANGGGALWIASYNGYPGGAAVTNSTISGNDAGASLGGALWVDSPDAAVALTHVTIAGNHGFFQGGIGGSGSGGIVYRDTLIAGNTATLLENEVSCYEPGTGSGVMQWPATRNNGNPDVPCIPGVLFDNPQLQPLADNGGATPTMAIPASSPAAGAGTTCTGTSATDQRGNARPATGCALGAYQP